MQLVVIAHNIRSTYNVGALFRTCDGLGVDKLYLTGYTPYPGGSSDARLPHLADKLTRQINKTALGAEQTVAFEHFQAIEAAVFKLKQQSYQIIALEQTKKATLLPDFHPKQDKLALILGTELHGLDQVTLSLTEEQIAIPMQGSKESFNVSIAAAIALWHLKQLT